VAETNISQNFPLQALSTIPQAQIADFISAFFCNSNAEDELEKQN
jgi:hypothetical protein